jgi:hypothetical protein
MGSFHGLGGVGAQAFSRRLFWEVYGVLAIPMTCGVPTDPARDPSAEKAARWRVGGVGIEAGGEIDSPSLTGRPSALRWRVGELGRCLVPWWSLRTYVRMHVYGTTVYGVLAGLRRH